MKKLLLAILLVVFIATNSQAGFWGGSVGTGGGTPTFEDQAKNIIFGGPATGADAAPTFRSLVDDDIPDTITCSNYLALATATAKGVFIASAAGTASFVEATGTNKLFGIDGSGNIGFFENISLVLNTNPTSDSTYSGTLATFTCGQSGGCEVGKIVYGKLNSTAHNVYYYDADGTDKAEPPIGVVVVAGSEAGTTTIMTNGILRLDSYAFTASTDEGKRVYASTTAGSISVSAPADAAVVNVGFVIEPPGIVYFNFPNFPVSNFGNLNVITTGTLSGKIPTVSDGTATTYNVSVAEARAGTFFLNTYAGTKTFVLPAAEAGMAICVKNGQGVAQVLRIDTDGTDYIVKSTGARTSAAGDYYGATSSATNQICVACFDATDWYVTSEVGTWSEE